MPVLLFASEGDDPELWSDAIRAIRPDIELRTPDALGDRAEIAYAMVWKPRPGLLASLPNLKVIFSLGAGVDALLADPTLPRHLPLVRLVDEGLSVGMREWVVLQVLDCHRLGHLYRRRQGKRLWKKSAQPLAGDRKVGILGLGVLGADCATALARLGFDVAGWSRRAKSIADVRSYSGPDGLEALARRSEILVCLLPLTDETSGIIDAGLLSRLPQGAAVINAARGGHVVEGDLLAALNSGHLSRAVLDVFAVEPLPSDHPFWSHPKVTVTPHVAAMTPVQTAAGSVVAQLGRFERGLPLQNLVDWTQGY